MTEGRTPLLNVRELGKDGPTPTDAPFDVNVRVTNDTGDDTRPSLAIDSVTGNQWIAYQNYNGADWDIGVAWSTDTGQTWSSGTSPFSDATNEVNPSLTITPTGVILLAYHSEGLPNSLYILQSLDGGGTWGQFDLDINAAWGGDLTNVQFPDITAQTNGGAYTNGAMFALQAWCTIPIDPVNPDCGGGANVIVWWGSSDWSLVSVTFDLGGYFYYPWVTRTGDNQIFVDSLHPSVAWGSAGFDFCFDDEWYVADSEWIMTCIALAEDADASEGIQGAFLTNGVVSQRGIYPSIDMSGQNSVAAGAFFNATEFPNNPTNHNVCEWHSSDNWANVDGFNAPLDSATTDQRAVAVAASGSPYSNFHLSYYSDAVVTDWWTVDVGASWTGPLVVSDNGGTGVNDDRSTSVYFNATGVPYVAWQDDRDGNVNIYTSVGPESQMGNDTIGPVTRYPRTMPNPYVKNVSTSLEVLAYIDDSLRGSNNITMAQSVLTDPTVDNPSQVDWSAAWAMNLTGYNRSPVEAAWLWANETAASWPVDSCHRFWIRGRDSKGNWGIGNYAQVCVIVIPSPGPSPPSLQKAELKGSGYGDVTLTWSKSPDDGGGANSVVRYKVWKSGSAKGPFTVVANVTATGSASYMWNDAGAGHGDLRNFFYNVIASSTSYDSVPSRLAAKFFRTMSGGKQILSFPLEQANYDPMVVFQTFSYVYARTYVAGTPNPWWCHKPGRFINSLTQLSVEQGYWVEMDGPGTMTVAGLVPENLVISLKSGWNMVGFPSFSESYTFADLNTAVGGLLQLVDIYDPSAGPYYLQRVHRNAWSTTYMKAGYAYMVRVSSDVNWLVPSR